MLRSAVLTMTAGPAAVLADSDQTGGEDGLGAGQFFEAGVEEATDECGMFRNTHGQALPSVRRRRFG
jgi:hypothetical protein